jgi:hypothetical protein
VKLSVGLDLLVGTSLLEANTMDTFKKLGPLFEWIEVKSGYAMAIFLHYLYRHNIESKSAIDRFTKLSRIPTMAKAFLDPSEISARTAESIIESLPPQLPPED